MLLRKYCSQQPQVAVALDGTLTQNTHQLTRNAEMLPDTSGSKAPMSPRQQRTGVRGAKTNRVSNVSPYLGRTAAIHPAMRPLLRTAQAQ